PLRDALPILSVRATDSLGNFSRQDFQVQVANAAPDAPRISSPAAGLSTRNAELVVSGIALPGSSVQVLVNGAASGAAWAAGADGRFSAPVLLSPGPNALQATASDRWGSRVLSDAVNVIRDVSVPSSPSNLTASAQTLGKVRLSWVRSSDANVVGYQVYRSSSAFAQVSEAVRAHAGNLGASVNSHEDLP